MRSIAFLTLFMFSIVNPLDGFFVRKSDTYQNVAKDFSEFYQSRTIVFVHASPEHQVLENIEITTKVFKWKRYFNKVGVPTMLIHIEKIAQKYGEKLERLLQPLFIILNDHDNLKTSLKTTFNSKLDVSKAKWVIFLQDGVKMEDFFDGIYVPFDCELWVSRRKENIEQEEIITEIYRVASGAELRQGASIEWKPNTKTFFPKRGLSERRKNFHGQKLRTTLLQKDVGTDSSRATALRRFESRLNFKSSVTTTSDPGYCSLNGTCYGSFKALEKNALDIMMIDPQVTNNNSVWKDVSVSYSLFNLRYYLYVRKPSNQFSQMNILKPLEPAVWMTILLFIVIMSCSLTIMEYYQQMMDDQNSRFHRSFLMLFLTNLLTVHGAMCNQGIRHSQLTPIRIMCFTIHASAFLIIAYYSALITSALTSESTSLPFTDVKSLLADGSYDLGAVKQSFPHRKFMYSRSSVAKAVMKKFSNDPTLLVDTYHDGMKLLCNRKRFAFVMTDIVVSNFKAPDCALLRLDVFLSASHFIYLPPRSPYRVVLNSEVIAIWEHGIRNKMVVRVQSKFSKNHKKNNVTVHFRHILPLVLILLMGMATSIIIYFVERWAHRRMLRNPKIIITPNEFIMNRKYPLVQRSSRLRSIRARRSTQLTPKFIRIRELMQMDDKTIRQQRTSFP